MYVKKERKTTLEAGRIPFGGQKYSKKLENERGVLKNQRFESVRNSIFLFFNR